MGNKFLKAAGCLAVLLSTSTLVEGAAGGGGMPSRYHAVVKFDDGTDAVFEFVMPADGCGEFKAKANLDCQTPDGHKGTVPLGPVVVYG